MRDPLPPLDRGAPLGEAPCPDCGAPLGGRPGCAETFHALTLRASADPRLGYTHRAVHDAYCMQHPGSYTRSVKSFMAHFRGLCLAMEHGSDPRMERAIWASLALPPGARKVPPARSMRLTIHDIAQAKTFEEHADVVTRYLRDVWGAWEPHHDLARAWLHYAVAGKR